MISFFKNIFRDDEFRYLDEWSRGFWAIPPDTIKVRFSQQGYEDKGYGHIQQIVANVEKLLENYFKKLCKLNNCKSEETFQQEMQQVFKPNLILFYVATHLHDIGMAFPGIFKALSGYVKNKAQNPSHFGEIIHEYHHYTSFIVLFEMSYLKSVNPISIKSCKYLSNIEGDREKITDLESLDGILNILFENFIRGKTKIKNIQNFKIILAILCLLHKEINEDYLKNILKKFKEKDAGAMEIFNYWWSYFERAQAWTNKIYERFARTNGNELPGTDDAELLVKRSRSIIDLQLVEALLQYGDKTDITIERLARKPLLEHSETLREMPLKTFKDDIIKDGKIGYINTKIAQKVISDYARFRACCYIPVLLITVESDEILPGGITMHALNIVINYLRFDSDKEVFKFIRYQDEKDFFDLGFLRVIRFHIPTVIRYSRPSFKENPVLALKFKKKEFSIHDPDLGVNGISDLDDFSDTQDGLKLLKSTTLDDSLKNFPYTLQNCKAIKKYANLLIKKGSKKQAFHESCDMDVPSSFEIMAVLNLFHKED